MIPWEKLDTARIPGGSSAKIMRFGERYKGKRKVGAEMVDYDWGVEDVPMDFDSLAMIGTMGGSGGVIVMDDSVNMVEALANINATRITADRVVVLVDSSGSMAGTDQTVQSQLQQLSAAGISIVNRVPVAGFAIASTDQYSLLDTLLQGLAANPSADAVYVISDFSVGDEAANDTAAYQRLRMALHDRGARLYWSTVRDAPPPAYFVLARDG